MRARKKFTTYRVIRARSASLRPSKKIRMMSECKCVWTLFCCFCLALFKKLFMVHLSVKIIFALNSKVFDAFIDESRQQRGKNLQHVHSTRNGKNHINFRTFLLRKKIAKEELLFLSFKSLYPYRFAHRSNRVRAKLIYGILISCDCYTCTYSSHSFANGFTHSLIQYPVDKRDCTVYTY